MSKRNQYEYNDDCDFDYCFQPMLRCQYDSARPQTDVAITPEESMMQPTINDIMYTQGYLKTQIGKKVKIDFLIGTNLLIDKEGTLIEVGISYVVIREINTNLKVMCDLYSIKFVEIF